MGEAVPRDQCPRKKSASFATLSLLCLELFLSTALALPFPQATSSGCCGNEDKVANNKHGPPMGK